MMEKNQRPSRGFTLAETLIAMLLMSFVGLIITGGISMGAQVYGRIVERSNAELLLSTTLMELRDELDRAEEVTLTGDATNGYILEKYRSSNTNWRALGAVNTGELTERGIYIVPDKGYIGNETDSPLPLVTKAAATENLYAEFTSITFVSDTAINELDRVYTVKNGKFLIQGLKVYKDGTELADTGGDYTIRALESVRVYPASTFRKS